MLNGLTLLLVVQLVGEGISRGLKLPVPGPVVGLVLTLILLKAAPQVRQMLSEAANGLLSHLSLLFIPAGVGVVMYVRELAQDIVPIAIAIIVSTIVGLGVTAWVAQRLLRTGEKSPDA
jgi:holin-like protein